MIHFMPVGRLDQISHSVLSVGPMTHLSNWYGLLSVIFSVFETTPKVHSTSIQCQLLFCDPNREGRVNRRKVHLWFPLTWYNCHSYSVLQYQMFLLNPDGSRCNDLPPSRESMRKNANNLDGDMWLVGVSTMFPGSYVPRYLCSPNLCSPNLCSPVPMFPEPMFPGTYVPRYRCSPVPMFPGFLYWK